MLRTTNTDHLYIWEQLQAAHYRHNKMSVSRLFTWSERMIRVIKRYNGGPPTIFIQCMMYIRMHGLMDRFITGLYEMAVFCHNTFAEIASHPSSPMSEVYRRAQTVAEINNLCNMILNYLLNKYA